MKGPICTRAMIVCSIGFSFAVSAHAKDVNGVWVKNVRDWGQRSAICSRALLKENNKVVTYESGVFIVDGNDLRGKSATCHIKARKDDGQFVRLQVACPAQVLDNVLTLRIDGPDELTQIGLLPDMSTKYFRCPQ